MFDLGIGSTWQTGLAWLKEPRYSWPHTKNLIRSSLSDTEIRTPIKIILNITLPIDESTKVQLVMSEYWTFSEAACSLAKTIQRVKMVR